MSIDEQHMAFPKLFGAPAYARPPAPLELADRPFDLDELPILAEQTAEERALAEALIGWGGPMPHRQAAEPSLAARAFSLRGFTDRLRGRG